MSAFSLRTPLVGVLAALTSIAPATAQGWQQTLTGQTTTEHDHFGTSLARADGYLFVGAPRDDTTGATRGSGSVTAFAEGPFGWTEAELLLSENRTVDGNFGASLSLEGELLLVGAPGEDSLAAPETGIVYIRERVSGSWSSAGTLEVNNLAPGDRFGYAVAMSGDRAAVGAPGRDEGGWNTGCVIIFKRTQAGWAEDGRLFPPSGSGGARFGHAVAILGDTLIVGAPETNRPELARGAVYAFTRDARTGWSTGTELSSTGAGELQRYGAAITLGASTVTVGGPGSYEGFGDMMGPQSTSSPEPPRGGVWVFEGSGEEWSLIQRLRAPSGDRGDLFGQRLHEGDGLLSVSSGGRSTEGEGEGATLLYEESGGGWFLTQELSDPSINGGPLFGAVAVHAEGEIFVSGLRDSGLGTQAGCVQVFLVGDGRHQYCFGEMCPCGNNDPEAGCINSTGAGAELFALGSASLTEDDLVIGLRGLPSGTPALVFFSTEASQLFFGDGVLCVGGGTLASVGRLGRPQLALPTGEAQWGPGLLTAPGITATTSQLHLQAIYRDGSGFCGSGVNLSNALEFELIP